MSPARRAAGFRLSRARRRQAPGTAELSVPRHGLQILEKLLDVTEHGYLLRSQDGPCASAEETCYVERDPIMKRAER